MVEKLQPGDTVYVYSFLRFASGLKDLNNLLDIIVDEKKVNVISLHDDFDSSTEKGKIAKDVYKHAVPLINADPSYGLAEGGCLADIAPTLIELMGLKQPEEMTGHSLLTKK